MSAAIQRRARRLRPRLPGDRLYWRERLQLTVKAVLASVIAWLAARYPLGHAQPYFAPMAALFGVYPTVVRSVRESLAYAAGFLIGAALAIPVGLVIGPNATGIAAVLVLALLASGWRRLGEQSSQVAFTALFALLMGGHQVVGYALPRLADVAVGLAVGLAVNAVVFPPLYLRRAEHTVRQLRDGIAEAMETLARILVEQEERPNWHDLESRLLNVLEHARHACAQGSDSLRANPRAKLWGYPLRWADVPRQWPALHQMNTLEHAATYVRSIADTLGTAEARSRDAPPDPAADSLTGAFRHDYARLLDELAVIVRQLPEPRTNESPSPAERIQERLERPHHRSGSDAPGLWDPQKELLRLSRLMLDNVCAPRP